MKNISLRVKRLLSFAMILGVILITTGCDRGYSWVTSYLYNTSPSNVHMWVDNGYEVGKCEESNKVLPGQSIKLKVKNGLEGNFEIFARIGENGTVIKTEMFICKVNVISVTWDGISITYVENPQ